MCVCAGACVCVCVCVCARARARSRNKILRFKNTFIIIITSFIHAILSVCGWVGVCVRARA